MVQINAAGGQIQQMVVQLQLHRDLWMHLLESDHPVGEEQFTEQVGRGQAQATGDGMTQLADGTIGPLDRLDDGFDLGEIALAGIGERQSNGAAGCVVLGDPAFYRRFGFVQNPSLLLPGVPPDHFMALAWLAPVPHGEVSYHGAFNAVA